MSCLSLDAASRLPSILPICSATVVSWSITALGISWTVLYGRDGSSASGRGRRPPRPGLSSVGGQRAGGISTRLMTWMTPFDAITSDFVTFALFTNTFAPNT